jgi:hypothetical protein
MTETDHTSAPQVRMIKLSAPEKRLLDFAREQFGEHLSQFLLSGLGEEIAGQRWRFAITFTDGESAVLKRQVEAITYEPLDGSTFLPRGRDPLVLAALLHLLLNGDQAAPNTLRYERADVLSLLRWKDSKKARREIHEAEERYFRLTYKWQMNKSELAAAKLNFYTANETMLSEYTSINTEDRKSARVVFNKHFIEHLLGRSLFGIDWNRVQSIYRSS